MPISEYYRNNDHLMKPGDINGGKIITPIFWSSKMIKNLIAINNK